MSWVQENPQDVIVIRFTEDDVVEMAQEHGIETEIALARAHDWGRHIAATMSGYCAEQLESAIRFDQP